MGWGTVLSIAWGIFTAAVVTPVFHLTLTQNLLTCLMGSLIISFTVLNANKSE